MGPDGAVNIVFRNEIAKAKDPVAEKNRLVEEYRRTFANPFKAAELGYIDEVLMPRDTRPRLISRSRRSRTSARRIRRASTEISRCRRHAGRGAAFDASFHRGNRWLSSAGEAAGIEAAVATDGFQRRRCSNGY